MDSVYRDIYTALYYMYSSGNPYLGLHPEWRQLDAEEIRFPFIHTAIDVVGKRVGDETGRTIRSDAKFLLLLNFAEMVARPIAMSHRLPIGQIQRVILDDIALLIQDSTTHDRAAQRIRGEEITGHDIIDSLSRNWKKLKVSNFKIWE